MTDPKTTTTGKPRLEFFSKRVASLTLLICGAGYYWFSYRPWSKRRRHLELEAQAIEYWKIHNSNKENENE